MEKQKVVTGSRGWRRTETMQNKKLAFVLLLATLTQLIHKTLSTLTDFDGELQVSNFYNSHSIQPKVEASYVKYIHERIIWDCAWTWDETYFITVSRDKKAILWGTESTDFEPIESKVYDESIQAVDSLPYDHPKISSNGYLFALGFQSGLICIELVNLSSESDKWTTLATFELLHHMGIKRLIFKPQLEEDVVLASAAEDCIVNITSIKL